jgi:hypothetical protein
LYGSFWLIRDVAEGHGSHLLETSWHFAPDLDVANQGNRFIATPASGQLAHPNAPNQLTLFAIADPRWKSELFREYVSPAYGSKLSAAVVRCSARVKVPAEHAVLLIPTVDGLAESAGFFRYDSQHGDAGTPRAAYRYAHGPATHTMIFRESQEATWRFGPWTSNARFLYFCITDRRVDQIVFCDGTFLQLGDKSVISRDANLQWLEWNRPDPDQPACSDQAVAGSFFRNVLDSEIVT